VDVSSKAKVKVNRTLLYLQLCGGTRETVLSGLIHCFVILNDLPAGRSSATRLSGEFVGLQFARHDTNVRLIFLFVTTANAKPCQFAGRQKISRKNRTK
jgi:hypothetical protein